MSGSRAKIKIINAGEPAAAEVGAQVLVMILWRRVKKHALHTLTVPPLPGVQDLDVNMFATAIPCLQGLQETIYAKGVPLREQAKTPTAFYPLRILHHKCHM